MQRRFSYAEKGKALAIQTHSPPKLRVRVPAVDNSDLIRDNKLTLIGRLTNPQEQIMWNMIPFLARRWELKGKAIGSDLGRECFQYRFDYEEDIQKVLDNRPYHYSRWMVILQRWEPTAAEDFPSQIPFWIRLKGIPLHYWKKEVLQSLGRELGTYEDQEITKTSVKIKVLVNGLKPLIKETTLEFENGDEAVVTLFYERLEKHCSLCNRLSHEVENCPNRDKNLQRSIREPHSQQYQREGNVSSAKTPTSRQERYPPTLQQTSHNHEPRANQRGSYYSRDSPYTRAQPYKSGPRYSSQHRGRDTGYLPMRKGARETVRGPTRDSITSTLRPDRYQRSPARQNVQEIARNSYRYENHQSTNTLVLSKEPANPRQRRPPLDRDEEVDSRPSQLQDNSQPITMEEVLEELREVTIKYTNCADPIERAARVQRVAQGEEEGLMQNTAARLVELHNVTQASPLGPLPPPPPPPSHPPHTQVHIPVAQRLVFPDEQVERTGNTNLKPQRVIKKRLGRPPKNKDTAGPSREPGTSTRKRKVQPVRSSPKRRTPIRTATQSRRSNQPTQQNNLGVPISQNREEPTQPSNIQPPSCPMIPAIARPSSVFRKPANPHPSR